ncbi:MAG: hypothetical protein AAB922_02185 [Patescibacteria group bacterium]
MDLLTFVLFLTVIGVVVYGIKLAIAGAWQQLLWLAVGLIAAIWILGALGIALPTIPSIK